MKILFPYLKRYWKIVVLALFLAAINQIFSLLDPLIFRHVIDDYATKFDQYTPDQFFKGVGLLLLAAVGVAFVSRVAKNFQDYFVNTITQRMGADIYTEGISHSLELPYMVFEDQRSGETLGVLQKVRMDSEKLIATLINVLFTTIIGFIFVMIYAININWVIAAVYFATIPIIGFVSWTLSGKIKRLQTDIVAQTTALAGSTTESLRNIELVKSLGLAKQEIARLSTTTQKILLLELKKVKYIRSLSFIQGTTINFLRTSILFLMLYMIFNRTLTFGEFFSLYIYSFFLFGPLQELGNVINTYSETQASLKNFTDILSKEKEEKPDKPSQLEDIKTLEFKNVSYKHLTASAHAVENISFQTQTGETIAFVGPSGAGKTTLVKLLVGLYQPKEGTVLYNNISSKDIDLDELRKQIGLVTQDTQLFAGTIRENLLFVNPTATDEEILEVLKKAAAQTLLERADKVLDTIIVEGGIKVSVGELQRL